MDQTEKVAQLQATCVTRNLSPWRFVVVFGVVSLLVDVVYEGARSISGPFLGSLGAGALVIGAVTSAGEAAALVLRLLTGPAADRTQRYWAWAIGGYLITVISVPSLALRVGLVLASALLIVERVGKAVRTPAKDALLAYAGTNLGRGKAFAVHEVLDQAGAFVGPLLVAGALAISGHYRLGFAILAVPGLVAMAILLWLSRKVPEPAGYEVAGPGNDASSLVQLPTAFWRYAIFTALTMAGFATFGLIGYHLSSQNLVPTAAVPLIYAGAMATDAVAALITGHLYDRSGLPVLAILPVLAGGGTALAFTANAMSAIAGAWLWGAALGVHESTLRAGVAGLAPSNRRASAYGVFAPVYGVAWLAGGTLLGFLYEHSRMAVIVASLFIQVAALAMLFATRTTTAGRGSKNR